MADVYRRGRKSVHHAFVSGDPDDPSTPAQCQFDRDPGGAWGPDKPPGPECSVCFAGLAAVPGGDAVRRPRRGTAAAVGLASALAFLGGVWASPDTRPVVTYSASFVPASTTPSVAAPSATASQTPAPSVPVTLPPFTPQETSTSNRLVIVIVGPEPTRPRPTPAPSPAPSCYHPGQNLGHDECVWGHR